jgi:hypothetical protein
MDISTATRKPWSSLPASIATLVWLNQFLLKDIKRGENYRRCFPLPFCDESTFDCITTGWKLTEKGNASAKRRKDKATLVREDLEEDRVGEQQIQLQIDHLPVNTERAIRLGSPWFYDLPVLENFDREAAGPAVRLPNGQWIVIYELIGKYTKNWVGVADHIYIEKATFWASYFRLETPTSIQGPVFPLNKPQAQRDSTHFDENTENYRQAALNIVKYSVDELNFNHRSLKKPRVAEEFLEDEQTEES